MLQRREIDFLLYDYLKVERFCAESSYSQHDRETFDAILDSAQRVADETFANHAALVDAEEPKFDGEKVSMPEEVEKGLAAFVEAGFMGASFDEAEGGLQLPYTVAQALTWIFSDANIGTAAYPFLTMAAANLIRAHGSPEQRRRYMAPMIEGRWFGTMCLSEPQAGSSLGDIRCRADLAEDGSYRISGSKMWISGGEHELSENIIHLVLAKVPGQPPGTKGISLFIVPKYRLRDDGSPGPRNDVQLAGLNHKMGYRGTTNCLLNFGEDGACHGYLVGELNQGLACMFHMMNEARIAVGLNAALQAYSGYQHSLEYARSRPQGRSTKQRDPASPQIMISEHADVRHMLLRQKVYSEGALGLCLYGATLVDEKRCTDEATRETELDRELSILTPVIKAWSAHYGVEANYWGLQILGGYGYTRDYPLERIYRDNRLNPIHEGTNGIQSLDLLGRKVTQDQGAAFRLLLERIQSTVAQLSEESELMGMAQELETAAQAVAQSTMQLGTVAAKGNLDDFLANSWTYLEMLGHLVVAWIWLRQAQTALACEAENETQRAYLDGKVQACRYFFIWELPKVKFWATQLQRIDRSVLDFPEQGF